MKQWRLRGITSNGPADDRDSHVPELDRWGALRALVDQFPGMFWTTDCDLRITSSVGRALGTLGLGPNQLVGMTLAELFEDDIAHSAAVQAHARALLGETVSIPLVLGGRALLATVAPLADAEGAAVGVIGTAVDVDPNAERPERVVVTTA
jgi:PAS domain-containing protein